MRINIFWILMYTGFSKKRFRYDFVEREVSIDFVPAMDKPSKY